MEHPQVAICTASENPCLQTANGTPDSDSFLPNCQLQNELFSFRPSLVESLVIVQDLHL